MRIRHIVLGILVAIATATVGNAPAFAQATRTWVSGVGDDANPCSRTAPCKTFAGAISKTSAGGEINCLDPGGFGAVTITKSITIDCRDIPGSILASGTNGVIVNAAGAIVTLRGLSINGASTTAAGLNGVRFLQGAALNIENCVILGFKGASPNGFGVQFASSTGARLFISDTSIFDNGVSGTGGGVQIAGTAGTNAILLRTQVKFNQGVGVVVDGAGGSAKNVTIIDSLISANSGNGVTSTSSVGAVRTILSDTTVSNNTLVGVNSNGSASTVLLGGSVIAINVTGVSSTSSGVMQSFKNNIVAGNNTDGTPIGAFPGPGGTPLQ